MDPSQDDKQQKTLKSFIDEHSRKISLSQLEIEQELAPLQEEMKRFLPAEYKQEKVKSIQRRIQKLQSQLHFIKSIPPHLGCRELDMCFLNEYYMEHDVIVPRFCLYPVFADNVNRGYLRASHECFFGYTAGAVHLSEYAPLRDVLLDDLKEKRKRFSRYWSISPFVVMALFTILFLILEGFTWQSIVLGIAIGPLVFATLVCVMLVIIMIMPLPCRDKLIKSITMIPRGIDYASKLNREIPDRIRKNAQIAKKYFSEDSLYILTNADSWNICYDQDILNRKEIPTNTTGQKNGDDMFLVAKVLDKFVFIKTAEEPEPAEVEPETDEDEEMSESETMSRFDNI